MKKIFPGVFLSILSVVFVFMLCGSILLNMILLVSLAIQNPNAGQANSEFSEKVITGTNKDNKILVIPVNGMIADSGPAQYVVKSSSVKEILDRAEKDKKVKGVILKVNSPGGTITATDKMYHYIMQYKEKTKVPVVVYFDEVAASGGYYIAMTGDRIIAHPTTITGSIGVIMSFYQMQELLENKLGIKSIVIKSGQHKDIGSSSRDITEAEREILNTILQEMYATFLEKVRSGRKDLKEMPEEELKAIADGRIYTGKQALENKLIDALGYFEEAKKSACELAGLSIDKVSFVEFQKPKNLFSELLKSETDIDGKIQRFVQNNFNPKFYYLWCR